MTLTTHLEPTRAVQPPPKRKARGPRLAVESGAEFAEVCLDADGVSRGWRSSLGLSSPGSVWMLTVGLRLEVEPGAEFAGVCLDAGGGGRGWR